MAISITQNPNGVNLSQSPIVYTINESSSELRTSSSFQYVAELSYWTGDVTESGSASDYTLVKFPNASGVGIFDVSRILNSTFQQPRQENSSSVQHIAIDAYAQYKNNPTGSFVTSSRVKSTVTDVIDGYNIFQESITAEPDTNNPFWPFMTDGPVSQSYFEGNHGRLSVWLGSGSQATYAIYSASSAGEDQSVALPAVTRNTSGSVVTIPWFGDEDSDWPLGTGFDSYSVFLISGSENDTSSRINEPLTIYNECTKKYDNIRIKWKNRYGQFDYFNFNLVSKETFNTSRERFQPQIGSWGSDSLTYQKYESSIQNYITDSTLKLTVNSDYVTEDYNDIFKQFMSSDEIYWVYDEANDYVRPLALDTTNFRIKTNKVDKLIQYSFSFTQGQGYKLIF
tara:strand:+ start:14795 stop:15985 length:1191 start_codon:yes stop_codon:yes gene_type:complete